ncbi:glycosyltransferase family 25 protein [Scleromatobacter humisilvae]|uniref:Glycosyltransferase family 25 protein n=1 Tax=Scleromatobacter humisilvae TaxID=2897159 RepID=A0A9X2C2D9_9BURK|nr:glycosyltransferase family 25 protein [Scleromatobacter humisilvae]MCK9685850.1 glycosyltransferase family 25 protein [Scleromatobacter humisilvae]
MDLFDAIYIINLPARTDRKAEMLAQFRRAGITQASPQRVFFEAVRPKDAGEFPTIGTRGCFLSHLGVLKAALAAGHASILVLEDDLNFVDDFQAALAARAPALRASSWDIAYLGLLKVTPPLAPGQGLVEVPPDSAVLGLHMVAIKAAVMPELIAYLEAMLGRRAGDAQGGTMHVDGAYSWYRAAHPARRTMACQPPLGYQRASRTDIHALRWFDRAWGIRSLVAALRSFRNRR